MTEHFKDYLGFKPFKVRMGNNPLTYMHTTPNLDATGHHWVSALASFNFSLHYQIGTENEATNVLSLLRL